MKSYVCCIMKIVSFGVRTRGTPHLHPRLNSAASGKAGGVKAQASAVELSNQAGGAEEQSPAAEIPNKAGNVKEQSPD